MVKKQQQIDQELKLLLVNGDEKAFKMIFDNYYPQLVFFANKFVGSVEQAEDIVIEVFSKFWKKRESSPLINSFSALLYSATKNACIDYLRKEAKNPMVFGDFILDVEDQDTVLDGEEVFARLLQEVLDNIESLPSQCRSIFKLLYLEGKTTKEVAEMLGLSVQSVRNQKTRGLSLLREKVKPHHLLPLVFLQISFFYE